MELFSMSSKERLVIADKKPFPLEKDIELLLYDNKDLLGDLYVFAKQGTSGDRSHIPDLLTVDDDGKIFLVEIKKVHPKGENILLQALRYVNWIKKNPSEIKHLWQKRKDAKPEESLPEPEWNALDPGILLVAPSFDMAFVRTILNTQCIQFRFMTVERFTIGKNEVVAVNRLEQLDDFTAKSVGLPTTRGPYSWETYPETATTEEYLEIAKKLHEDVLQIFKELEIEWLKTHFNKTYISYKNGWPNVMCLYFEDDCSPGLSFYIDDEPQNLGINLPDELLSQCYWSKDYKEFYVPVVRNNVSMKILRPLFIEAKRFRA